MPAHVAEDFRSCCLGREDGLRVRQGVKSGRVLGGVRIQYFFPIYLLAAIVFIFQGLIIAGSPPNSAAKFFLLRINETSVGYTGICSAGKCVQTVGSSPSELATSLVLPESTLEPLLALQNSLSYSLPVAGCSFLGLGLILITVLLYLKVSVRDTDAGRGVTPLVITVFCAMGALWVSTILSWATAYSAQAVISALIASSTSTQSVIRGALVRTCQWVIFSFCLLLTIITQALIFPGMLPEMKDLYLKHHENGGRENNHTVRGNNQDSSMGVHSSSSNGNESVRSNAENIETYDSGTRDPFASETGRNRIAGKSTKSRNDMDGKNKHPDISGGQIDTEEHVFNDDGLNNGAVNESYQTATDGNPDVRNSFAAYKNESPKFSAETRGEEDGEAEEAGDKTTDRQVPHAETKNRSTRSSADTSEAENDETNETKTEEPENGESSGWIQEGHGGQQ